MWPLRNLIAGLRALIRKRQTEQEMNQELRDYLEAAIQDKVRSGLTSEEARRVAKVEMGSMDSVKEQIRSSGWESSIESLGQDLRYGVRQLRRNPGFTAVAVLTLALGIGATTAIFSVTYTVLLQSAPYARPDELVEISEKGPETAPGETFQVSAGDFNDWQQQAAVFQGLAAYDRWDFKVLTGGGDPDEVWTCPVTTNLFQVLGVNAARGRTFAPKETQAVILSHPYWQRHFASDPTVVGTTLALDGKPYTVVGVAPANFQFPAASTQMWIPLTFTAADRANHQDRGLNVIARLRPGFTLQQAQAVMDTVAVRQGAQYPKTNAGWSDPVSPFEGPEVRGVLRTAILALLGAVAFVLMIVCFNVASMLLARGAARRGEMAIRAALGAGRLKLIRQLVVESVLLAIAGGAGGLVLAWWGIRAIIELVPRYNIVETMSLHQISMNFGAFAFAAALSLLTGIAVGLLPATRLSSLNVNELLKEHGRTAGASARAMRLQRMLVATQVAFTLVLLAGAGLMIRSFERLKAAPTGFDPDHLLTVRVPLMNYKYSRPQSADFYREVLERIKVIPGVKSVGMANNLPFTGFHVSLEFPPPPGSPGPVLVAGRSVSPGYFRAMGMRFIEGRDFTEVENQDGAPCVRIVNKAFARLYFPAEDPLGQRLRGACPKNATATIVGLVADSKQNSVDSQPLPELYEPYAQHPFASFLVTFAIRTSSDPRDVARAVRHAIWQVDRDQPVIQMRTMEEVIAESIWRQHVCASMLGVFALIALVLAGVGIYGVLSYSVSQRTHEFGIRMALGARPQDVLGSLVGQGLKLTLVGVAVGIAGALSLTRLIDSLLYGVKPTDPLTFMIVSLILIAVALLACYIPARRATKVDPMVALRYE